MRRASGVHAPSPARQSSARRARSAVVAVRRVEQRGARRAAARRCRSSGSPSAGRRRRRGPSARSRSSCDPWPNAIAVPASRPCWRTRKRRCFPSPTVAGATGCVRRHEQRDVGVAEAERREPVELLGKAEREVLGRDDGVDDRDRVEILLVEMSRPRARRTPPRTPRRAPGSIESPAAARWPPKRSRCSEQAASAPCRSKLAIERPEPLQPSLRAGDEHDRAVEALDEPRGDDADHALVPVLAREDVAAAAALPLGQRLDERDRLAQDPVLDRLALAVQLLELCRELAAPRAASSVRISSSAMSGRPSRPAALMRGASRNADRTRRRPRPGRRARSA